ncbi:MAG: N-formylglutamate amidohydrolase, partial [Ruegeria sp.]
MSAAFEILNPDGKGRVVLICEHASPRIPSEYKGLGLADGDRHSHAAWDLGALAVARLLSDPLDAPVVASTVSRLVYDCNRPPEAASAVPQKSELISI